MKETDTQTDRQRDLWTGTPETFLFEKLKSSTSNVM
jgi:hypothetical protein